MLIVKTKAHRLGSFLLHPWTATVERVFYTFLVRYRRGTMEDAATKQDAWDGSQRGKHGVLSYVGLSKCLCERSWRVNLLSAPRT